MSDSLRLGLIGCGSYAQGMHAPALAAQEDVELTAICGPRRPSVDKFLAAWQGHGRPQTYSNPLEMLEKEDLHGVLISTPHNLHAEQVTAALAAGCHVLVEKPMTISLAEAEAAADAARKAERHVLIGYKTPYTGTLQAVRRALREERYGPLRFVTGYITQNWQALTAGTWRHDPAAAGGGQFLDSGSHPVCSLLWALPGNWQQVSVLMADRGDQVDVDTVVTARFDGDVLVSLAIGGCEQPEGSELIFCCAEARIEMDGWRGTWARVHPSEGEPEPISDGPDIHPVAHFCDVLRGNVEPLVGAEHGCRQAAFVTDVYRAALAAGQLSAAQVYPPFAG